MKFLRTPLFLLFLASCAHRSDNKNRSEAFFKMAYMELASDDNDVNACRRALEYIDQALCHERRVEFYALKATLLFKLGDYQRSGDFFKKALESAGDNGTLRAEIMNNYACLLAHNGGEDRACAIWLDLIKNPGYQTPEVACVNLGKICIQRSEYVKAKDYFQQAVLLSPSYLDAHVYLAKVAHRLGLSSLVLQETSIVQNLL